MAPTKKERRPPLSSIVDQHIEELRQLAVLHPTGQCPASLRTLLLLDIWLSPEPNRFAYHLASLYAYVRAYTDFDTADGEQVEKLYQRNPSWRKRQQALCTAYLAGSPAEALSIPWDRER
jgi:hypothetical protein